MHYEVLSKLTWKAVLLFSPNTHLTIKQAKLDNQSDNDLD